MKQNDQDIGKRIYGLRRRLSLSRKEFCHKHNISEPLMRALECSMIDVKPEHSQRLLKAFQNESIVCTEEWLLKGTGTSPLP